ncbi:MAG TPA: aldo/keto reductase [Steroidobacteraceae bacterium]|nr:aldo/keto reductase [Steroidobacteraceae bacterium]
MLIDRRDVLLLTGAALLSPAAWAADAKQRLITRKIPSTGEAVPVIGLGTSGALDVGDTPEERADVEAVLKRFFAAGATLIDTAPSYGRAEGVVGDLVAKLKPAKKFLATKVSASGEKGGRQQIDNSFKVLKTPVIDLLQIHSLKDWKTHSKTLRQLKEQKKVRYIGITHSNTSAHKELEEVMRAEQWDWVQLNYSIQTREAEERLLPLAQELGVAVMVNRAFEDGAIFQRVANKPLPQWASEIGCATWGQFFLKYVLSHPAVTCVIPATAKVEHMADNLQAGRGTLPEDNWRGEMVRYFKTLR